MRGNQIGQMDGLLLILELQIAHHPLNQVDARKHGRDFRHETFGSLDRKSRVFVLHLAYDRLDLVEMLLLGRCGIGNITPIL